LQTGDAVGAQHAAQRKPRVVLVHEFGDFDAIHHQPVDQTVDVDVDQPYVLHSRNRAGAGLLPQPSPRIPSR